MNKEQLFARAVVEWLAEGGWEVYQEVVTACGRCDIVAVQGPIRWAIEVKTTLNLAVLDQAYRNTGLFHHSSVAVPAPVKSMHNTPRSWALAHALGQRLGFGLIRIVLAEGRRSQLVKQDVLPRLNRHPAPVSLHEEQKTWCAAGSSGGGYYTRFQRTVRQLERYVLHHPGTALREAVRGTDHHYASVPSAVSALSKLIRGGVLTGLRLEHGKLYPAAAVPDATPLFAAP